jgi:Domain of unknown function (DUF4335)
MLRSHPILRRYTPPTCTLEVMATRSSLSRWAGQPVLKDLRFNLSLDDPTIFKEEWVTLRGDRDQLEALSEAITTYIQSFLGGSQAQLDRFLFPSETASETSSLATLAQPSRPSSPLAKDSGHPNAAGISLHPKGMLNHELRLGTLATEGSEKCLSLSTLQLFDLANALEEYAGDGLDLPNLQPPTWYKTPSGIAQIAAGFLVVVGLSASGLKLMGDPRPSTVAGVPTSSQGASSSDQRISTQISPSVAEKAATPPAISTQILPSPSAATGQSGTGKPTAPTVIIPQPAPTPFSSGRANDSIASVPVPNPPMIIPGESTAKSSPEPSAKVPVAPITGDVPAAIASAPADLTRSASRRETNQETVAGAAKDQANATAFDTIPQVGEVRSYFQQRWKPPEGLSQTLEYRLVLDANGSIQSVTPLKQAAGEFIDRTGMPLAGEPFVSALQTGQSAKIRLVLSPDGKVQTFLED